MTASTTEGGSPGAPTVGDAPAWRAGEQARHGGQLRRPVQGWVAGGGEEVGKAQLLAVTAVTAPCRHRVGGHRCGSRCLARGIVGLARHMRAEGGRCEWECEGGAMLRGHSGESGARLDTHMRSASHASDA